MTTQINQAKAQLTVLLNPIYFLSREMSGKQLCLNIGSLGFNCCSQNGTSDN